MNYKEIVDLIKNTCEEHYFINQVGYGNLSDLNTPEDEEPPLYPYAFINPVSISQSNNTGSLSVNLIMMTQTYENETNELIQQSNCIKYINDVIAHINMNLDNPDVEFVTPFTITPFKERFSDDVVGATANITINFSSLFNDCTSPYCIDYQTICNSTNYPEGLAGTLTYWQNATFEGGTSNNYKINCGGDYAMYTGTGVLGDPIIYGAWDVNGDGTLLQWQRGIITDGTIDCGNTITYIAVPTTKTELLLCGGTYYPLNKSQIRFGACQ